MATTETVVGSVMDYGSGAPLEGEPSVELALRSAAAGDSGAVAAYRDADGVWQYVADSQVGHARTHLGHDVVTVWVDADAEEIASYVGVEVTRVAADASEEGEGPAYWVTAEVCDASRPYAQTARLFAAPHADGRPGLAPCGDSLDDWCDLDLRRAYGDDVAQILGREAIALARA